jgi:hypothetical protein
MYTVPSSLFSPLPAHFIHKEKLLNLFDSLNIKNGIDINDDTGPCTDYFVNRDKKSYPCYHEYVSSCLEEYLKIFSQRTDNNLWKISDMWYQQTKLNQRHEPHTHGMPGFSAIWYLEFDPAVHEQTTFYSPFPCPLTGNTIPSSPNCVEGSLFIFPSYVLHEQKESKTNVRRTIVSFNLYLEDPKKTKEPQVNL